MLPLILASSSIYRKALLERLHIPFQSKAPDIDETPHVNETAKQLAKRLSIEKAKALALHYPKHLIIGSDQVACLGQQIIGKSLHFEQAFNQLKAASGRRLCFYTGLALLNTDTNHLQSSIIPFYVDFRELSDDIIRNYLLLEKPYDCAGSFKAEGLGVCLFKETHGSDSTSLIGIPLISLTTMLYEEGVILPLQRS